ncbi:MAG TPA: hypothetical protein VMV72_16415 [Verrucomicrobiae bacterium]|nr:hypothetical protein [Verrucomicrobiae bacterium]
MLSARPMRCLAAGMVSGIVLFVVGCTSYYAVTDPATSKTYYTTEWDTVRGGATRFVDARNGAIVTIHESEIREISEKDFKDAGGKD